MQSTKNTTAAFITVMDSAKFEAVESIDISKNGRSINVLIIMKNGDWEESDGEHGPNDFLQYGFKLAQS